MADVKSAKEGPVSLHDQLHSKMLAEFKAEASRIGLDATRIAGLATALSELPISEEQILRQVERRAESGSEDAGE